MYSCSRFTITSNSESGSTVTPVAARMGGQVVLVPPLHLAPLRPELGVVDEGLELPQPVQIGQPPFVPQPGGDQGGQPRVGEPEEPPGGDAVGHVAELSGHSSAKSRSVVSASRRDCSSATPLTAKLPTTARLAIRTRRSGSSWISDIRVMRSSSPG